jgi:hypothetical protein
MVEIREIGKPLNRKDSGKNRPQFLDKESGDGFQQVVLQFIKIMFIGLIKV